MPQRLGDHVRYFRSAQMTLTHAAVKVTLHLAARFAMDFRGLLAACIGRETAQSFSLFALEAQEHFLRKRIREPKRDEVCSPFPFDMRQVTARVNSAAERIGWLGRNSIGAQLELHTFQTTIGLVRFHMDIGSGLDFGLQFCVGALSRLPVGRPTAGRLPTCDTADCQSALPAWRRQFVCCFADWQSADRTQVANLRNSRLAVAPLRQRQRRRETEGRKLWRRFLLRSRNDGIEWHSLLNDMGHQVP